MKRARGKANKLVKEGNQTRKTCELERLSCAVPSTGTNAGPISSEQCVIRPGTPRCGCCLSRLHISFHVSTPLAPAKPAVKLHTHYGLAAMYSAAAPRPITIRSNQRSLVDCRRKRFSFSSTRLLRSLTLSCA